MGGIEFPSISYYLYVVAINVYANELSEYCATMSAMFISS